MHIYFEFKNYDGWDEFDNLLSILTNQMKCRVLEKLDGIWSRHCFLERNEFSFKLMYHEDFGNCLCNQEKKDSVYYSKLESISKEVVSILEASS